jgi:dihydrofolate synthase/folylpolyglutamate synthase
MVPGLRSESSTLNADEARAYWFNRINYEQISPKATDLKLERMHRLLEKLGNPQEDLRIVHVAGSKGKGSTSAMIASILRRAGYRTGLFTSPHLCRVEERIEVNGQLIAAHELTVLLNEVAVAERALGLEPDAARVTFFEVATALGFLHFARCRTDVAVVEVGLGGRFDSTNVCCPEVALITSISRDHTELLGHRLGQIALEKGGIIKPGRPALSGARGDEARGVIEGICRERRAPLRRLDAEIHYRHEPGMVTASSSRLPRVQIHTDRRTWPKLELGLLGDHQAANAALAVAAIEHLQDAGFRVGDDAVAAGLAGVRWPARLEVIGHRPLVVLDCAHNGASAQALVDTLNASFPQSHSQRLLVFAASADKDLEGMFQILASYFSRFFLTRYSAGSRSVSPEQLAAALPGALPFTAHPTAVEAWRAARNTADADDLICATGSVFLAGELRPKLLEECAPV